MSCRKIAIHSGRENSRPTPKVGSLSWPRAVTFCVVTPSRMSVRCPAPKYSPVRNAAENAFCAASDPSKVSGGWRQVSQLPQSPSGASPK